MRRRQRPTRRRAATWADGVDFIEVDRSSSAVARSHPVRTCVGCRERSPKSDLLRLVVTGESPPRVVSPDPRGTAPGRGAHLHPTVACLDLAERRRAFSRALRVEGSLDLGVLRAYVEAGAPDGPGEHQQNMYDAASPDVATERKRSTGS
ncbi:MAG TPA: YlxR family protein [Nocardioidaceae bacterium]|nr:YlxR family protein [Nocardioidaceae bacterium]